MGRHAADGRAEVDPIVAAALRQRPTTAETETARHGAVRHAELEATDGGLGWPAEPADGTGLGWPEDLAPETLQAAAQHTVDGAPVHRRLDWRRLFGSSAA